MNLLSMIKFTIITVNLRTKQHMGLRAFNANLSVSNGLRPLVNKRIRENILV